MEIQQFNNAIKAIAELPDEKISKMDECDIYGIALDIFILNSSNIAKYRQIFFDIYTDDTYTNYNCIDVAWIELTNFLQCDENWYKFPVTNMRRLKYHLIYLQKLRDEKSKQ